MRATERKAGSGMGSEAKLQQERKRGERSERDGLLSCLTIYSHFRHLYIYS